VNQLIEGGRRRRLVPLAALAVVTLAISGCSGSSPEADQKLPAERAADSTTTTGKPALAEAVVAGYRAFWDAYLAAADPMNPEDPRLVEHATGNELETVQKAFLARRSAGEVIRGTLDLSPRVETINPEGTVATVIDCYADHTGIYDAASGTRKDKESGVRHLIKVEMTLTAGAWKVSTLTLEGDGCTPAP
jgi:hypothetical protein